MCVMCAYAWVGRCIELVLPQAPIAKLGGSNMVKTYFNCLIALLPQELLLGMLTTETVMVILHLVIYRLITNFTAPRVGIGYG